jgi:hypothetical protein
MGGEEEARSAQFGVFMNLKRWVRAARPIFILDGNLFAGPSTLKTKCNFECNNGYKLSGSK